MNRGKRADSPELRGGAGFTFEDAVVAYYLAALLLSERAAGLSSLVTSVAIQQKQVHPMDDLVVEFEERGVRRTLGLQLKRQITISAAQSNTDFREIMAAASEARRKAHFQKDIDAYGFATEYMGINAFRDFERIIAIAKSDSTGENFARAFKKDGSASKSQRELRDALSALTETSAADEEADFYRHFVPLRLDGLAEGGIIRADIVNRLQRLIESNEDGQDLLLFDRLCRIAREGAASARTWTRQTLLTQLRGAVRLKVSPNYEGDIGRIVTLSKAGLADVSEEVANFRVERPTLERLAHDQLKKFRLVNLSGLPGCGKSALLKRIASVAADSGPILFLKYDRLEGKNWLSFSEALGITHQLADLLAEIGSAGTPIVFIDGIDRITPDQEKIVTDILRTIEANEQLANWKVLVSSRYQGLEVFRTWFPASFYQETGIGDVAVGSFSDEEAEALAREKPNLRRLLFETNGGVSEIARRPFFAAVLARSFREGDETPQTEVDLISAWWKRAGHDAPRQAVPQRQRALIDFAEKGVRNLGKNIRAATLKDATFSEVSALEDDLILRSQADGSYSFTHDIFFEWAFYRLLIERGDNWICELVDAGEPPLLGRVVSLLAQNALTSPGKWSAGYHALDNQSLRSQWQREWLTAPPFTPSFVQQQEEFEALLRESEWKLLEKLLVWFQAQHTIPSPVVLANARVASQAAERLRMADLLGWPSDVESWSRLIAWLLPRVPTLPKRLVPHVLEVFEVWQNLFASYKNPVSKEIVRVCQDWLIDLEKVQYPSELPLDYGSWNSLGSEARSGLGMALRMTLLQAAKTYPAPTIALLERAVADKRMRGGAYSDLLNATPLLAEVAPDAIVDVTKAELVEELPQERRDRKRRERQERLERINRIREIPESERTEAQQRALKPAFISLGSDDSYGFDDYGIDRHHSYYFPTSALHEPFASLFEKKPELAIRLVHDLANRATEGWRQTCALSRKDRGTPIPLTLEFPWGSQQFWGNWHVYNWFMGQLAPQPLECAFLSLSHWAFRQIESGRPADEVIRCVVEGSQCYASLGLALVIALESYDVSETTLPIASCQRLWMHDMARVAQEPLRGVDLFGFGIFSRLSGRKAEAKEFLDSRLSRRRDIKELAMQFALTKSDGLRERFKEALGRFPENLPYEFEEQKRSAGITAELRERAEQWAGLGDFNNYRKHVTENEGILISYEAPKPLTEKQQERLDESVTSLKEYHVINWATKSLGAGKLVEGISLADAVAFAKSQDSTTILNERREAGEHSPQTSIAAVAAVAIRFGGSVEADVAWAWGVMRRISKMREPRRAFSGAQIPWHPANYLVVALMHDRASGSPRNDSARLLLELTNHHISDVAELAFVSLFRDRDNHVRWVAAQLAIELSVFYRAEFKQDGSHDDTANRKARKKSVARALKRLDGAADTPLADLPRAWIKSSARGRSRMSADVETWVEPDPLFNAQFAAKIFPNFPVEAWCRSSVYKPMFEKALQQLVSWTAERLMPSWRDKRRGQGSVDAPGIFEWNHALGDLIARAAPFFEAESARAKFLEPFLTDDDKGLPVLSAFVEKTVSRQILDAVIVPANTFALLDDCADRVIRDRTFDPDSYRAGQVAGHELPKLISALLFVGVDQECPGATRFANGDYSEINIIMPLVTRLVTSIGWSVFVMQAFLKLCERAGASYPLDSFALQAGAVLSSISKSKGSWTGTTLQARTAAVVQRLAETNFPLQIAQARELLKVLDALIDLGDRRSAALEQTEAFRGVQGIPAVTSSGN